MINAQEAYNKTKYTGAILKVKDFVELVISNAVDNGDYICNYEFEEDVPSYVENAIIEWLRDLGYKVDYHATLLSKKRNKIWITWKQEE